MSKACLVTTAVTAEGLSQREAACWVRVSQGWAGKLLARNRAERRGSVRPTVAAEDYLHIQIINAATGDPSR